MIIEEKRFVFKCDKPKCDAQVIQYSVREPFTPPYGWSIKESKNCEMTGFTRLEYFCPKH